jgi:hypothetical protein
VQFQGDVLLTMFADVISLQQASRIRLSVITDGFVVSGMMISDDEYFSALSDRFLDSLELKSDVGEMKEPIVHQLQVAMQEDLAARDENRDDAPARRFIHLRDVEIRSAEHEIMQFPLWRIRLDHVAGYDLDMKR